MVRRGGRPSELPRPHRLRGPVVGFDSLSSVFDLKHFLGLVAIKSGSRNEFGHFFRISHSGRGALLIFLKFQLRSVAAKISAGKPIRRSKVKGGLPGGMRSNRVMLTPD